MKILITGGNGYIAKSLLNAYKDKYDITTITRQDFDLTDGLSTKAFFANKYFDVVIHAAIKGGSRLEKDNGDIFYYNLLMYDNLVDCKDHFAKLITFGSGAEITQPKSPYGFSKRIIRDSILSHDGFYNLRIFAVFDENEDDRRFIKSNIKRYLNRQPMQIFENKKMDFFYMQDLINLVRYYITFDGLPKEIDCVYEQKYSLLDISNIINETLVHKVDLIYKQEECLENYTGQYINLIDYNGINYGIKKTLFQIMNQ